MSTVPGVTEEVDGLLRHTDFDVIVCVCVLIYIFI